MAESLIPPDMTPHAVKLLTCAAGAYGVQAGQLFLPRDRRTPEEDAARERAVALLANEALPTGRARYPIKQLQEWFGCSRNWITELRRRGGAFTPRRKRSPPSPPPSE